MRISKLYGFFCKRVLISECITILHWHWPLMESAVVFCFLFWPISWIWLIFHSVWFSQLNVLWKYSWIGPFSSLHLIFHVIIKIYHLEKFVIPSDRLHSVSRLWTNEMLLCLGVISPQDHFGGVAGCEFSDCTQNELTPCWVEFWCQRQSFVGLGCSFLLKIISCLDIYYQMKLL